MVNRPVWFFCWLVNCVSLNDYAVRKYGMAVFFAQRQSEDISVLAQDYPSAPANPSNLAKRDARGCVLQFFMFYEGGRF